MARYTGHRTNIEMGGFAAELTSITPPATSGDPIDATHLETEDVMDWEPPDLPDGGELQIAGHFDPSIEDPVVGADAEEVVINFPQAGKKWTFTGFWTAYTPGEAQVNQKIPFTGTIKRKSLRTTGDIAS